MLYILDYGAGNVRSLANSIRKLGFEFEWVKSPEDIDKADKLMFPGVGAFGPALQSLRRQGYAEPLKRYIASGKPYMGICIGLQALFESSDESEDTPGLGIVPGRVGRFDDGRSGKGKRKAVPQMGWNTASLLKHAEQGVDDDAVKYGFPADAKSWYYFVHSYRVALDPSLHSEWALTTTQYGDEVFLSSIQRGNVFATQFHPEKSGRAGLELLRAWLSRDGTSSLSATRMLDLTKAVVPAPQDGLTKRIVACLDVRSNDQGDLVVTKGESYDVREKDTAAAITTDKGASASKNAVRNLGKPVDLALRYYLEGADEVTFLNITSFRSCPLHDQPMIAVVEHAAASIFVPLTIGGGIKDSVDPDGTARPALEVADAYFRAGADKVSIGSEAVYAVEALLASLPAGESDPARALDSALTGTTPIETISRAYGAQAVVVSVDPRRVYVSSPSEVPSAHAACMVSGLPGTDEEGKHWWYRCTVKGGREDRDVDAVQLARGVQRLGAGEVLLNSIDKDGSNSGFDRQLIDLVRDAVDVPVIASSGAGRVEHFSSVFAPLTSSSSPSSEPNARSSTSSVEAALAAGILHRKEVTIGQVKTHLSEQGFPVRMEDVNEGAAAIVNERS